MIPITTTCSIALLLSVVGLTGCTHRTEWMAELPREDRSLGDISKFFFAVASAKEVLVYEGLPHPGFEHDLYVRELKRPDVIWFEGYPFYAEPLLISEAERKTLTEIAVRQDGHVSMDGLTKFCGGFHPDYAIIWKTDGKKSGSLVCFGCHEWKNFTPAGRLYEDLGKAAYDELRALLAHRVVRRPKPKRHERCESWLAGNHLMQDSEFYKNAFEDPAFRREKLEELRYFKKVEVWFIGLSVTGFFAHTLYAGLGEGEWAAGVGWLVAALISCAGYAATSARAGALEAIEEREATSSERKATNPSVT